ncbi:MAG TPA: lysylphosphatidylglycerol synthase transmembrane domain-containing protein, partial [Blastocatellia bacterium]|nr:lysylphosphatidylglycerol synthase transmembrane domain-containing protein [Blastocatellia bacterium]
MTTKKTATLVLKIAVSVGIYVWIFKKIHIGDLWGELRNAKLAYFVGAVLVYYIAQGLSAYRWYLMLKPLDIKTSYPRLLSYYFLGVFFNFLMPTAIGGDVFRVYYLNKETRRLSASTASVFIDRDVGMAGLVLVAAVVATYNGTSIGGVLLAPLFWLILFAFTLANLALFYRRSYDLLHRVLSLFRLKRADEKVERLFLSFNAFRGKWALMGSALLLSIVVQVGCAFVNLLAAGSIG